MPTETVATSLQVASGEPRGVARRVSLKSLCSSVSSSKKDMPLGANEEPPLHRAVRGSKRSNAIMLSCFSILALTAGILHGQKQMAGLQGTAAPTTRTGDSGSQPSIPVSSTPVPVRAVLDKYC